MSGFRSWLDRYFSITSRGSSLNIELLAGVSTFLTLSYIVIVNPAILSEANLDKSAVFFATVVVSGLATIAMGIWARLPFALAPGLEIDTYVAFFVVGVLHYSTHQAMGIVFWSTIVFFILSALKIRQRIIDSIPDGMKHALASAIGVFVALIGFKLAGIVTFDGATPSGFGSASSPTAIALYIGLGVILVCQLVRFRGAILVSVIIASLYCATQGLTDDIKPVEYSSEMFSLILFFDPSVILDPRSWAPILILFLVDFYGSVAKIIGLSIHTTLFDESTGQPINTTQGLYVDGVAATMSPIMGTSSVTTFVESAVGIQAGGRTGITAIVCGTLILCTFALAPLLKYIPVVATSGGLVIVGWWLLPKRAVWERFTHLDWIASVGMGVMAAVSFSLERAMLFGYSCYLFHAIFWKKERPNIYLIVSFLLLLTGVVARYFAIS